MTTRVVDRVMSMVLGVELVKMIKKLRDALKNGFAKRMEEYGFVKVGELASKALDWGYGTAKYWASDFGFVRYLTMMDLNWPTGYGV